MTAISVIVPTYNRAASLAEAIQSLLAQTWSDFEVVVVDDGSTDDTPAVVGQIADERVRYLRCAHAERSVARNRGLAAAEGGYIAFLDDDDICLPHRLECQAQYLNDHQDCDVVGSGCRIRWEGESRRTLWTPWRDADELSLLGCLLGRRPSLFACMFRRSVLAQMNHWFDARLVLAEDVDFVLRLVLACGGRATWLPEVVYEYRLGRNSPGRDVHLAERIRRTVLDKLFSRPDLSPEVRAQRQAVYAWHDVSAACTAYAAGQSRLAQFFLLRGLALRPILRTEGADLLVDYLALSAALQPDSDTEHSRLVNEVFDSLPSPLASWEAWRARALDQVQARRHSDVQAHSD